MTTMVMVLIMVPMRLLANERDFHAGNNEIEKNDDENNLSLIKSLITVLPGLQGLHRSLGV